jgi:hypothetical protein
MFESFAIKQNEHALIALTALLIKKGIITQEEFERELKSVWEIAQQQAGLDKLRSG